MEELRSTEILDKEIFDDANRKADRIYRNAKIECEKVLSNVSEKIAQNNKQKTLFYEQKIDFYKKDLAASIPLEKERLLVDFVDEAINQAMEQYFSSLSKEDKIQIIKNKILDYKEILNSSNVNIVVGRFDKSELKPMLEEVLGKNKINKITVDEKADFSGCVISTEDNSITARASIEEKITEVVDIYRNELSEALFGGEIRL